MKRPVAAEGVYPGAEPLVPDIGYGASRGATTDRPHHHQVNRSAGGTWGRGPSAGFIEGNS